MPCSSSMDQLAGLAAKASRQLGNYCARNQRDCSRCGKRRPSSPRSAAPGAGPLSGPKPRGRNLDRSPPPGSIVTGGRDGFRSKQISSPRNHFPAVDSERLRLWKISKETLLARYTGITELMKPRAQFVQFLGRYPQAKEQSQYIRSLLRSQAYRAARLCRASARW